MSGGCILDPKECWVNCGVGSRSCGGGKQSRGIRVAICSARHGAPILLSPRWRICHPLIYVSISHPAIRLELVVFAPSQ